MNRAELDGMTLEELYRTAAAKGLREAPGLPREAVIARLVDEPLVAVNHKGHAATDDKPAVKATQAPAPSEPPLALETTEPPLALEAAEPPLALETAAPPLALETAEPPLALETAEPPLALETAALPLAVETAALPLTVETAAPPVALEPAAPPPAIHHEPFGMLDLEELPEAYGVDECELIAKDPFSVFVYWEVTPAGLDGARRDLGDEGSDARLVTRLIATAGPGDRGPERETRDHALEWNRGRRYFPSPRPGARVRAAVGLVTPSGLFAPIAQSSQVRVPPAEPAAQVSAEWMEVQPAHGAPLTAEPLVVVHRGPGEGERGVGIPVVRPSHHPASGHPSASTSPSTSASPSGSASEQAEGATPVEERDRRGTSPWRWRPGSQS